MCIDCDACVEACPVDAIFADFEVPEKFAYALDLNAEFFAEQSTAERTQDGRLTAARVAIVGAGPAGAFAADRLLRARGDVEIDLFERLPTPWGLLRAGVAPDHQEIKRLGRDLRRADAPA